MCESLAHSQRECTTLQKGSSPLYLDNEGTKDNTTEDKVVEDAIKDVSLSVDLAGVDLVEKLHHYEGIEDNGVVFRGWGVEGCVPAAVDIKEFLTCRNSQREIVSINGPKRNTSSPVAPST